MANPVHRADVDPVANNLASVTPIPPPLESTPGLADVGRAGLVTAVTSSLVCWIFFGIGTLFGTEFDIHIFGMSGVAHLPWYLVLVLTFTLVMLYALVASGFRDRRGCRRWCLLVGYSLGAVGIAAWLFQPEEVTWPTRIWLILCVVATTWLSAGPIARVVGDTDPWVTAGHRRIGLDG